MKLREKQFTMMLQTLEDKINIKMLATNQVSMIAWLIQLLVEIKILITKEKDNVLTSLIHKQQKEELKEKERQQCQAIVSSRDIDLKEKNLVQVKRERQLQPSRLTGISISLIQR